MSEKHRSEPGDGPLASWDELPRLVATSFPRGAVPHEVAAAIIRYMRERHLLSATEVGVVLADPEAPLRRESAGQLIRAALRKDAIENQYAPLSPWVAYFFKPVRSHGPGIGEEDFVDSNGFVDGDRLVSCMHDVVDAYNNLVSDSLPLALRSCAATIVRFLYERYWSLLHTLAEPLTPRQRSLLINGLPFPHELPYPADHDDRQTRAPSSGVTTGAAPSPTPPTAAGLDDAQTTSAPETVPGAPEFPRANSPTVGFAEQRILALLASVPAGERLIGREVAERTSLTHSSVKKWCPRLSEAGLIDNSRESNGGYAITSKGRREHGSRVTA